MEPNLPPSRTVYVPKKSRPGRWLLLGLVLLFLLVGLFASLVKFSFKCSLLKKGEAKASVTQIGSARFSEQLVEGEGEDKIVIIPVYGLIAFSESEGFWERENVADRVIGSLKKAARDPEVKAIILKIDSPGGGVTAADVIHHRLGEFKADGKKVVALLEDLATSAAYYIACGADLIVAHPTTTTGNIGVLVHTLNFKGLMNKVGLEDVTIKSGQQKDILSPFRALTPEEKELLQKVVDEIFSRFIQVVAEGRDMEEAEVRPLADGRVFTGKQALELNLVDEIGYEQDAIRLARELCGLKKARVVEYRRIKSLWDVLRGQAELRLGAGNNFGFRELFQPATPRLLYLWTLP